MKKNFYILITTIWLLFVSNAFALIINSHSAIETNCDGWVFWPLVIYWTDWYHLWDYLDASREWIISSSSEVSTYIDSNKLNIPNGWVQVSNYVPSPGPFYAIWNNNLTSLNLANLVPADRNRPIW
jgi:hypothetical protein